MRFVTLNKEQNNSGTCFTFTSSALLHLFFTSNSTVFMKGGARIFLAQGERYLSYTAASKIFQRFVSE